MKNLDDVQECSLKEMTTFVFRLKGGSAEYRHSSRVPDAYIQQFNVIVYEQGDSYFGVILKVPVRA